MNNKNASNVVNKHMFHIAKELFYALIGGVLIAVVCQAFFLKPFYIPSSSMEPTLLVGDMVIVNRQAYTFSDMHRGDVIVFEDANDWMDNDAYTQKVTFWNSFKSTLGLKNVSNEDFLTKRIIGLPGDRVSARDNGYIYVNGKILDEDYLPSGRVSSRVVFDIIVPKNKLWVMGDNRPVSADSLFYHQRGKLGFVPQDAVIGKVVFVSPSFVESENTDH